MSENYSSSTDSETGNCSPDFASIELTDIESHKTEATSNISKASGEDTVIGSARTKWQLTASILTAEVMGLGILSLPHATISLGWVAAAIALPLFCVVASYCSWLLAKVKQDSPSLRNFYEASTELVGPKFGLFTKIAMLVNWGMSGVFVIIATADAIGLISSEGFMACEMHRIMIAAIIILLPSQCRDFHSIAQYLSTPSTVAIIVSVSIILVRLIVGLASGGSSFGETTTVGPAPGTSVFSFFSALSAFTFAYLGQDLYLQLMSEMKDAREFPKACNWAYTFMGLAYTLCTVVSYGILGENTPGFLPDALPDGSPEKVIVGVLVVFHIAVQFGILMNPFNVFIHQSLFPHTVYKGGRDATIHWFLLTLGFLLVGFIVANMVPFFADFQALIGSVFSAPIMFGWPALLFGMTYKRKADSWTEAAKLMGWGNAIMCCIFIFILCPLFVVLGTYGAIEALIADTHTSGFKLFGC